MASPARARTACRSTLSECTRPEWNLLQSSDEVCWSQRAHFNSPSQNAPHSMQVPTNESIIHCIGQEWMNEFLSGSHSQMREGCRGTSPVTLHHRHMMVFSLAWSIKAAIQNASMWDHDCNSVFYPVWQASRASRECLEWLHWRLVQAYEPMLLHGHGFKRLVWSKVRDCSHSLIKATVVGEDWMQKTNLGDWTPFLDNFLSSLWFDHFLISSIPKHTQLVRACSFSHQNGGSQVTGKFQRACTMVACPNVVALFCSRFHSGRPFLWILFLHWSMSFILHSVDLHCLHCIQISIQHWSTAMTSKLPNICTHKA